MTPLGSSGYVNYAPFGAYYVTFGPFPNSFRQTKRDPASAGILLVFAAFVELKRIPLSPSALLGREAVIRSGVRQGRFRVRLSTSNFGHRSDRSTGQSVLPAVSPLVLMQPL